MNNSNNFYAQLNTLFSNWIAYNCSFRKFMNSGVISKATFMDVTGISEKTYYRWLRRGIPSRKFSLVFESLFLYYSNRSMYDRKEEDL